MTLSRRERRHSARVEQKSSRRFSSAFLVEKPTPNRWRLFLITLTSAIGGAALALSASLLLHFPKSKPPPPSHPPLAVPTAVTLGQLLEMSPEALADVDVAEANLLCAKGLPGSEKLDVTAGLRTLDHWADAVSSKTQRNFHRFQKARRTTKTPKSSTAWVCSSDDSREGIFFLEVTGMKLKKLNGELVNFVLKTGI